MKVAFLELNSRESNINQKLQEWNFYFHLQHVRIDYILIIIFMFSQSSFETDTTEVRRLLLMHKQGHRYLKSKETWMKLQLSNCLTTWDLRKNILAESSFLFCLFAFHDS